VVRRTACLALAALALAGTAAAGPPAEPFRIGFLGTLSGPLAESGTEALEGLQSAVRSRGLALGSGAKKRSVEVITADDGDEPAAALRGLETLAKARIDAVVAAPSGRTVQEVVARARAGRTPVVVIGAAAPVLDPASPVIVLAPSPVDQAMAMASVLALRTRKPLVGVTTDCARPGLVVEDSPAFRAQADALSRTLGVAQRVAGTVLVAARGKPDAGRVKELRAAGCDRLVLLGEPDMADAIADACTAAGWRVPVLAAPGLLSGAASSFRDGRWKEGTLLAALPQKVMDPPAALRSSHAAARGDAPLYPRTVLGWMAANLVLDAAEAAARPREAGLLEAMRDLRYGPDEASMPLVGDTGRAALFRFLPWRIGERGPEPANPKFLPLDTVGPLFGAWPATPREPVTTGKVVAFTFGDGKSAFPRSIESDLAALGLHSGAAGDDASRAVLDEILARTVGKLHLLFLKEYDGTPVPGVSFDISFTRLVPAGIEKGRLWTALVAGTGPPARKGGSHDAGAGGVYIHSSWLVRNLPALARGKVVPPVAAGDLRFLRGEYLFAESVEGNDRSDGIRGMVDALAGAFAMKAAKEIGMMAGLSLDHGPDVRSIMNVDGGEGLRETNLHFTPKDSHLLERALGRCPAK